MLDEQKQASDNKHRKMTEQHVQNFAALAEQHSEAETKKQLLLQEKARLENELKQTKTELDQSKKSIVGLNS